MDKFANLLMGQRRNIPHISRYQYSVYLDSTKKQRNNYFENAHKITNACKEETVSG